MATIITKNSSTASSVPLAAQLVQGELAVNVTDKRLFTEDSGGTVVELGTNPSTLVVASGATIQGLTVGRGAGAVSTNTAVGFQAAYSNTTGTHNTALGYSAGNGLTTGSNNSGFGSSSIGSSSGAGVTGNDNTSGGYQSLKVLSSGAYNTAFGSNALQANTTASNNTAVGFQAGYSNTTGNSIVAIGYQALRANTTAPNNTAVGFQSGLSNTTGQDNSAHGVYSLYANTTGSSNTAVGSSALEKNTTASNNTAVGYQAGYSNTTGQANVLLGKTAGFTNSTGNNNVYIGSGRVGSQDPAGYYATGSNNTFVGGAAGATITTGASNTIIGQYNGNQGGLDIRTASNYIVLSDGDGNPRAYANSIGVWTFAGSASFSGIGLELGGGTVPTIYRTGANGSGLHFSSNSVLPTNETGVVSDNTESFGTISYRWTVIFATTGTINTSDQEQKQDIQAISAAELAVATEIKTLFKTFRWKDAVAEKGDNARIHVGVIAQDVQAAFSKHGLDAKRYALWCSDTWYEVDGVGISNDGIPYTAESAGAVEKTRLGIRYDQLLAFVIAAL